MRVLSESIENLTSTYIRKVSKITKEMKERIFVLIRTEIVDPRIVPTSAQTNEDGESETQASPTETPVVESVVEPVENLTTIKLTLSRLGKISTSSSGAK